MTRGEVLDASAAKIVIRMLESGMTKRTVAELVETSQSTVKRVRRHYERNAGAIRDPKPGSGRMEDVRWHFGGARGEVNSALLDRVAQGMDASATHEEIYAQYKLSCPLPAPKLSTVSAQLRKLDFTTKRLSSNNPDRNAARCAAWYARVSSLYTRRQLLCIDEVGCNSKAANRMRGLSKKGTPAVTHLNILAGGSKYSGLGVFSEDGFQGMHVVDGAFNKETFLDAIDRVVVPRPGPVPDAPSQPALPSIPCSSQHHSTAHRLPIHQRVAASSDDTVPGATERPPPMHRHTSPWAKMLTMPSMPSGAPVGVPS